MTFPAKLTELIENNKDHHFDKYAQLSAYFVNHAEAIRGLVASFDKFTAAEGRIESNNAYQDMKKSRAKLEEE